MGKPIVTLTDVTRSFAGNSVLDGLNLTIYAGEATAIVGRNGSGKSTLLKIIAGLGAFDTGERQWHDPASILGFVPDRFPKMRFTAAEYLQHMGRMQAIPEPQLHAKIGELGALLQLDPSARKHLRHYSKGNLQKVNLMQAMLRRPDLLLLDEPLSGLDRQSRDEWMEALLRLKDEGVALVLTTHERELAERVADRETILLHGKIAADHRRGRLHGNPGPERRRIVFALPDGADSDTIRTMPGIRNWRPTERGTSVETDASRSDSLIWAILGLGGSILAVDDAPSDSDGGGASVASSSGPGTARGEATS